MYYPDQRFATDMVLIQRSVALPEEAIGKVLVKPGQRVDIHDKIARGMLLSRHYIINAMQELRLNSPDKLPDLMLVQPNVPVSEGDPIAGRDPNKGRRVFAPTSGVVMRVIDGRIIMQANPDMITLEAGVRGTVGSVTERGALIEAKGALVQGVWGNGRNVIAIMRLEPKGGIESLRMEEFETAYRSEIVVTTQPLTVRALDIAEVRGFAGIIAPSMDASLIDRVKDMDMAIILTEGFGQVKMTTAVFNLLKEFDTNQVTLDAYLPRRLGMRRPEAVINRMSAENPPKLDFRTPLRVGMRVRINRDPYVGQLGKVVKLPRSPIALANGLRVLGAEVTLLTGETVKVPLANLELAGT